LSLRVCIVVVALTLVGTLAGSAQTVRNPSGPSLRIRTETGATEFEVGELIMLALEFSDRDGSRSRYDFDERSYDRSGRLETDRVHAAPAEYVEDPLYDYYRSMGMGGIAGGLSKTPAPLASPRVRSLDLNEFVRFTRPGTYQVYIQSHRFMDRQATTPERQLTSVVSNTIEINITPRRANGAAATVAALPARALRHADTAAAAAELARRLLELKESASQVDTDGFHLKFGLFETTHRAASLQVIRQALATTTRAVNGDIPRMAAFLDAMLEYPRIGPARDSDDREPEDRRATRIRAYMCRQFTYQRQALAAGLRGSPEDVARAVATFAVAERPAHCTNAGTGNAGSGNAGDDRDAVARLLPPVFARLDAKQQRAMLSFRWALVADEAMLPALRALVAEDSDADSDVRDLALVRLGELAPEEAERVSWDDIASGRFRFGAQALQVRADREEDFASRASPLLVTWLESRPRIDRLYMRSASHPRGILPLLARFGSADHVDRVLAASEPMPSECELRTTLAAYVLRVDEANGTRLLDRLLNDSASRCAGLIVDNLTRTWPDLLPEQTMIDTLDHPDREVAASAARALARIGGPEARKALWARLRAWNAAWRDRAQDLRVTRPAPDHPVTSELMLERNLRSSLQLGVRWRATEQDRMALRDLCVTDDCREALSHPSMWDEMTRITVVLDQVAADLVYRVNVFSLRSPEEVATHLALFARMSTFEWHAGSSQSESRTNQLYLELRNAAAAKGVNLLPRAP